MNEQTIFAKCAWRLIPFMVLLYVVSFIDRSNVGFAALTMDRDLGFSPSSFAVNRVINATGVLVPVGPGASAGWRLKPRNGNDVVVQPLP